MSKYYDPKQLPKEPVHIIIDGIGGLHCNNNEQVLLKRIYELENMFERQYKAIQNMLNEPKVTKTMLLTLVKTLKYDMASVYYMDYTKVYKNPFEEGD